jgi:hypothetical protein
MTVLFSESFDNMSATDGLTYHKWFEAVRSTSGSGGGGAGQRSLVTGRLYNHAIRLNSSGGPLSVGNSYNTYDLKANQTTVFVGMGYLEAGSTFGLQLLWLYDHNFSTIQLDVRYASGGFLTVTRNGTLLCTSSGVITTNTWNYLELGALISATVGWAELRLNGVLVASYYGSGGSRGASNGNTQGAAAADVRYVRHGGGSGNNQSTDRSFDDLYVCNASGGVNNDFLGNVVVYGTLPNAVGANSGFTRTGGSVSGNFTAVDENPIDGDTSYVASSVVSTTDTYKYAALPASANTILAVVAEPVARIDDAGGRTLTTRVRGSGGTEADYAGSATNLPGSYNQFLHIMETSPVTTVAWVPSDINSGEFGPKVAS